MRIAVVSPFLDRQHGAERCLVEQIEYLLHLPLTEVHLYAQRVQDLETISSAQAAHLSNTQGKAIWHGVSALPGPHLFGFLWWFAANTGIRWFHRKFRSLAYDVVYSAGINCPDADAIVVHVVFREFLRHLRDDLQLRGHPLRSWPAIMHRNLYYRMITFLENWIYPNRKVRLAAVSHLTARELRGVAGREDITVIPNAVDAATFNPEECARRRTSARTFFHFQGSDFALLLLGNGWKNKGLNALLDAMGLCHDLPLKLLVVGRDDRAPFERKIRRLQVDSRVLFAQPSADVLQFYAAADAYVGPSLHDSFALPPLEAMACGLPVITSSQNGGSEVITDGVDGFVLANPQDRAGLAQLLRSLCCQPELCRKIGAQAATTAKSYDWERNGKDTLSFLQSVVARQASL